MLTPSRLPSHLGFEDGSWRSVRGSEIPSRANEGPEMGRGSHNPSLHTYCTDGETETQRENGEAHRPLWGLLSHLDA